MITSYQEALDTIFSFENCKDYSLEKMKKAMKLLGNPLKNSKVIHITGTNGKGSVSKMMFAILKTANKKVGVFTSPHLLDIRERFDSHQGQIEEDTFILLLNKLLQLDLDFSYFEKCTLIAFLFFEYIGVEYAIVEVGFGGLLDSTNIVQPVITAITSIGYDHTKVLGNTLEEISAQKAGIIKPGIPIVYNHHNPVIANIAKQQNAPIIFTDKLTPTNLQGIYQQQNASIAYEISKYLGIKEKNIKHGLMNVVHRGRLDFITHNILIDAAHNQDGITALKKYLQTLTEKYASISYCFALKREKDSTLLTNIIGKREKYIIIDYQNVIIEKTATIQQQMDKNQLSYSTLTPEAIIQKSTDEPESLFVVFGSLYMIGRFYLPNLTIGTTNK